MNLTDETKTELSKLIIAIDFDGTIVEPAFPEIGVLKKGCKRVINQWFKDGHFIIINTCRVGELQGDAEKFLKRNGINFHYVNTNLPETVKFYGSDSRKISAQVYIDDRQLGGLPDWLEIERIFIEKHLMVE